MSIPLHPRCQALQAKLQRENLPAAKIQEAVELCSSNIQSSHCDDKRSEYVVPGNKTVHSSAGCYYSVTFFAEQKIKGQTQPPQAQATTNTQAAPTGNSIPLPVPQDLKTHITKQVAETSWSLATTKPQNLKLYVLVDGARKIYTLTAQSALTKLSCGKWKITYDLQLTGELPAQTKGEIIVKDEKEWNAYVIEIRVDKQNKAEILLHAPAN